MSISKEYKKDKFYEVNLKTKDLEDSLRALAISIKIAQQEHVANFDGSNDMRPTLSLKKIGDIFGVSTATAYNLVKRLKRKGYLIYNKRVDKIGRSSLSSFKKSKLNKLSTSYYWFKGMVYNRLSNSIYVTLYPTALGIASYMKYFDNAILVA